MEKHNTIKLIMCTHVVLSMELISYIYQIEGSMYSVDVVLGWDVNFINKNMVKGTNMKVGLNQKAVSDKSDLQ